MALTTCQHSADRCSHNDTMKTWVKWAIAAAVVIVVALVAGPFVYINFIKDDAPERFALDDQASTTAVTAAASTTGPTATAAPTAAPTGDDGHRPDGGWWWWVMVPTGCG